MSKLAKCRLITFIISILLLWGINTKPPSSQAQVPSLSIGFSTNGVLAPNEAQDWQLQLEEDQSLSFFVNRSFGNLDPVLLILDAEGEVMFENDDRIPGLVYDAALIDVSLEGGQSYTLRVQPYSGSGLYRLWVLPSAYGAIADVEEFDSDTSRWESPFSSIQGERLDFNLGSQRGRDIVLAPQGVVPRRNLSAHVEFDWPPIIDASSEFGLVLGAASTEANVDGLYFVLQPDGAWRVFAQEFGQERDLDTGSFASSITSSTYSLTVHRQDDDFTFFINGQAITEVSDTTFSEGLWGLMLFSEVADAQVLVERLLVTVPEIAAPMWPSEIENWRSARPDDIANELAAAGAIPNDGRRSYTVLDTALDVSATSTRSYPQAEAGTVFTDMLINVDVQMTSGENIACGAYIRDLGIANRIIFYADSAGGVGLLYVKNGRIIQHTYDLLSPSDDPLPGERVRLTLIAQGAYLTLYANGNHFITHYSPASAGEMGVILMNYGATTGGCSFSNLWIWQ